MRIVTFNNLGTGHVLEGRLTACGKTWPGVLGPIAIDERGVRLCGNCESAIGARPRGKTELFAAMFRIQTRAFS